VSNGQLIREVNYLCVYVQEESRSFSLLSHSSDIDDLLEGLDGVLEDWLDGLHDTESSFHIVEASASPLASLERADERVDSRLTRRSSSFIESYLLAATVATRAAANFICDLCIKFINYYKTIL